MGNNWIKLAQALKEYCLWACTPANDDWPVVDEVAKDMPRRMRL